MQTDNRMSRRERRGYLILLGLVLAAAAVFNMDAILGLFERRVELVALVPETSGIRPGSPVLVAGVEAGRVTGVEPLPGGRILPGGDTAGVAVSVWVGGDALALVRTDSDVQSGKARFIGESRIQIFAGTARGRPVEDGDTLVARTALSPGAILAQASTFPATLDSLLTSVRRVGALVEERRPELERLQTRLTTTLGLAGQVSEDLRAGVMGQLTGTAGVAARLARFQTTLRELAAEVDRAAARYGAAGAGTDGAGTGAAPLAAELERLSRRAGALSEEIAALQASLADGSGALFRMQQDSALAVAVGRVRAEIDSLRAEGLSLALRMFVP